MIEVLVRWVFVVGILGAAAIFIAVFADLFLELLFGYSRNRLRWLTIATLVGVTAMAASFWLRAPSLLT